jgi:hypothetical protein
VHYIGTREWQVPIRIRNTNCFSLIASCSQMKSFVFFPSTLDCFTLASGYPLASPSTRLEPMHTQYSIHIRNSSHCRQNLGYERVINSGVFFSCILLGIILSESLQFCYIPCISLYHWDPRVSGTSESYISVIYKRLQNFVMVNTFIK